MSRYVSVEGGQYPLFYSQLVPDEKGKWVYPDDLGPGVIAQAVLAMPTFRTRITPDDAEHQQKRRVQIIVGGKYFDANSTGEQFLERLRRAQHPDGQPYVLLTSRSAEPGLIESVSELRKVRKKRASRLDNRKQDPWIVQELPIVTQVSITLVENGYIPPPEDVANAMSRMGIQSLKRLLEIDPHKLEVLASGGFSSSKLQQEYRDLSLLLSSLSTLA